MCIFCDIVNKKIDVDIVFENDKVFSFFPKKMEAYGHLLVIPKKHYENIFDIAKDDLTEFIFVVQTIANKVKEKLGATGVNILNASGKDAGQSVNHLHFHILPRFKDDGIDAWPDLKIVDVDRLELKSKIST